MSRHRDFRNLNISAELEDDALSDGGEEPMTQEEEASLYEALEKVHAVVGSSQQSNISDKEVKDQLWNSFFDVEETIQWVLDEQERRRVAQERKEAFDYDQSALEHWRRQNADQPEAQSRLPKIILAQQQALEQGYSIPDTLSLYDGKYQPELSIITERTEVTEPTPAWQPRYLEPTTPRHDADSSRTTSYGEVLEDNQWTERLLSDITPKGTPKANPIPLHSSGTIGSMSVPSIRTSSATTQETREHYKPSSVSEKPLPVLPPSSQKSKLSMLASSRASTVSSLSQSSRDDGTALTGSIKTFPILRPSAQSERGLSPVTLSAASKDYTPSAVSSPSQATGISEMTAQVQKAINAALELEALDKNMEPERPKLTLAPQSPPPIKVAAQRSLQSPLQSLTRQAPRLPRPHSDTPKSSPAHKAVTPPLVAKAPQSPSQSTEESHKGAPPKPISKLAMLAQQKVSTSRAPKLPESRTEYLVPTANGPTATTAITTSYQSLYSLTDPKRPAFLPKLDTVPLPANPSTVPDMKKSKLAMKIQKASEKQIVQVPVEPEETVPSLPPMFLDTSPRARASPSAFASVLVHEDLALPNSKNRNSKDRSSGRRSDDREQQRTSRARNGAPVPDFSSSSAFTFDSPSPDDIVFNARRGTSLAHLKQAKTATTSTLSSRS